MNLDYIHPSTAHEMAASSPTGEVVSLPRAQLPSPETILQGQTVTLERLGLQHAPDVFALIGGTEPFKASLWNYMPDGPYPDYEEFAGTIALRSKSTDPFFFAVIDTNNTTSHRGKAVGYLSLMRITADHLTIEIGNVLFSAALQRTTGATEAVYLLAEHAFHDLGYRRVEWKCNALNERSRRAAARLGFVYEGTFRQHMIVKGRNRDTAWFALLRDDWERREKGVLEKWLDERNFEQGRQKKSLDELRADWGS